MKCQSLFSGKNEKNISNCHLLNILPSMLNVNEFDWLSDKTVILPSDLVFSLVIP